MLNLVLGVGVFSLLPIVVIAQAPISSGKNESIHRPAPVQNFSLPPKKWGPQREDFGGRYGFPGFFLIYGFVSTTGLESFSLKREKFSK